MHAFKARLDKIWLHQAVKFVSGIGLGRVGSKWFRLWWVGLGQSADGLGWIGSHKMDPWTTLRPRRISARITIYSAVLMEQGVVTATAAARTRCRSAMSAD